MDKEQFSQVREGPREESPAQHGDPDVSGGMGTVVDYQEMEMMGKSQELNRNFRFISILGFSSTAMATWELILASTEFGLLNGGLAGLVWGCLIIWMGYCAVFASIAELSSLAPTAGGQYHWTSELAPRMSQRFLSYLVGWFSVVGWQAGLASITYIAGTLIQGLVVLNYPDYVYQRWQGTLLTIALSVLSLLINTFLAKRLPLIENLVLALHILGFFAVLITLWVLAPLNSASLVFTQFENLGGWSSQGLSFLVGLLTAIYGLLGADSSVHMSEEIRDASIVLPRSIMWSIIINGALGWVMIITFCFTLGNPLQILDTHTGYPFIAGFLNATRGSYAATSVLVAIMIVNIFSCVISAMAAASRQLWAFARDNGVPFSSSVSNVSSRRHIPLNALLITCATTTLLSLINIGSTAAFEALVSMGSNGLLSTYIVSLTCVVIRRVRGPALRPRRWSLGKAGLAINITALLFLAWIWVFCFFPVTVNPTLAGMNWNVLINGGVMVLAVVYYYVFVKRVYVGPVSLVKLEDEI